MAGARHVSEGLVTLVAVNGLSFRGEFTVAQYSKQPHQLEVLGCWEYSDFRLQFPELDEGDVFTFSSPFIISFVHSHCMGCAFSTQPCFWGGKGCRGSVARVCLVPSC